MRLPLFFVLIALGLGGCAPGSPDEMFSAASIYHSGKIATGPEESVSDRVNAIVSRLVLAANPRCAAPEVNATTAHLDVSAPETERLENFGPTRSDPGQGAPPIVGATNCAGFTVVVISSGSTFASTNGRRIQIARGFVEFTHNDSELAFVIAHEMAHMLKGHRPASDIALGYAQEVEADHLGFQILARAGYDADAAIDLLRRMQVSGGAASDPRHPSFSARADILQKERAQLVSSPPGPLSP